MAEKLISNLNNLENLNLENLNKDKITVSKSLFIKELVVGTNVKEAIFLVTKKTVRKKRSGEPYCILSLQDKSGSIEAVIWSDIFSKNNLYNENQFNEGDFLSVCGDVYEYKGGLQLTINSFKKIRQEDEKFIDLSDFIRKTSKDINKMLKEILGYIDSIKNSYLRKLLKIFFNDKSFVEQFCYSSAAVQYHHAYIGGLIEHTLSTVKLCNFIAENYREIKAVQKAYTNVNDFKDLVVAGAILHDIGKIEEYQAEKSGAFIKTSDRGKLIGHITIGYGMVLEKISKIKDFPVQLKDRLLHIILSHHGHKEFGSPKRPKTIEAFIVYHADHLDADIGGFSSAMENNADDAEWSEYLKNFDRSVLLKEFNLEEENNFDFEEQVNDKQVKLF